MSRALEQETPLPLYLAMKVHAVMCKRTLIDTLFHWGICVSYDRLLKVILSSVMGSVSNMLLMELCVHQSTLMLLYYT